MIAAIVDADQAADERLRLGNVPRLGVAALQRPHRVVVSAFGDLQMRLGRQHPRVDASLLHLGKEHGDEIALADRLLPVARLKSRRPLDVAKESACPESYRYRWPLLFHDMPSRADRRSAVPSISRSCPSVRVFLVEVLRSRPFPFGRESVPPDGRVARPTFQKRRQELILQRRPSFGRRIQHDLHRFLVVRRIRRLGKPPFDAAPPARELPPALRRFQRELA